MCFVAEAATLVAPCGAVLVRGLELRLEARRRTPNPNSNPNPNPNPAW